MIGRIAAVCAVALAPILFWQAASNAGVPQAASWNGFETSKLARGLLQLETEEGDLVRLTAPPSALSLAAKGYIMEPMATTGLVILAQAPELEDDPQRRNSLILKTVDLHKRDRLAQTLAIEEALKNADYAYTFARFDDLAALRLETVGPLVSALQPLLETEERRVSLRDELAKQPRWGDEFWRSIPTDDLQFAGYLSLRRDLEPEFDDETKRRLAVNFVRRGMRTEAVSLVSASFENQTIDQYWYVDSAQFPPIGWQLAKSGDASLDAIGQGSYRVFLARSQSAALARQIVSLPPDDYVLSLDARPSSILGFLSLRLACLEGESRRPAVLRAKLNESFSIEPGCSDYALEIYGDAWNSTSDLRGELSKIRLEAR